MTKSAGKTMEPPTAKKLSNARLVHDVELDDPYAWMRADNWQEVMRDPEVLQPDIKEHLEAENAWLKTVLEPTEQLQEKLFEEMKGRIKEDDSSVPSPDGPYAYSVRYVEGAQHPQLMRSDRNGDNEKIILNADDLAKNEAFFKLGASSHSPCHKYLAYSSDTKGSEYFTVRIKDLETDEYLGDEIPDTGGSIVWSADSKSLIYVKVDENHRPSKVFLHHLGQSSDDDVLIYEEADPGFFVGVGDTQDQSYIVISSHDHQTAEMHIIPSDNVTEKPKCLIERQTGHEYSIEHRNGELLILSNWGDAEDFFIASAAIDNCQPDTWKIVIPHKEGRLILSHAVLENHLVWLERDEGLPRIMFHSFLDGSQNSIQFAEEAYSLGLSTGYEFNTTSIRFTYSSMTTPAEVYDFDLATNKRVLRKRQEVPSGHNPSDYVTRRILAPAIDGELVPISLLHRADLKLDGSNPLLLYGYGAYGISIPAAFSTSRLSLVDRGFVFALTHIRGGKDKGYRWYKKGRAEFKKNTFTDFIAAGNHLISEGYTARGSIIAQGGSAGGMLMGAVANMDPDMFLGIIAEVPFVDVLNTMLDETLPLTPPEWPEWGNPITSAESFEYIHSYSPYENIECKNYPHILATGGLADPRVTYWEPAKWIARLRESRTNKKTTVLKTNMQAGHGGRPGRFEGLREVALSYAFALMIANKL